MRLPLGNAIARRVAPARPSPTKLRNILNSDTSRVAPAPIYGPPSGVPGSPIKGKPYTGKVPLIASPSRASNMPFRGTPNNNASNTPQGSTSSNMGVHPVVSQIAQQRNAQFASPRYALSGGGAGSLSSGSVDTSAADPSAGFYNRAYNSVDVQLTPQEQALQRQAALAQQMQQYQDAQSQANTQRTVNEQKDLYNTLIGQLNGQMPAIGGNYDAASSQAAAIYQNLQDALSKQYGTANDATTAEVQRLGLDPALPTATGQINSDAAFLKGLAGSDSAVLQGTFGNEKANALKDALANIATQQGAGTALSAGTLRDALNTRSTADMTNSQKVADLLGQSTSLEGTRKGLVGEAYSKLQDVAAQQAYQAQQDAITNALNKEKADAQFALSGADVNLKQAQADAARMDSMTKSQVANATIGKTDAEKQAILDKMTPGTAAYNTIQAQIAKDYADAGAVTTNAATNQYKATHPTVHGLAASNEYLNSTLGGDQAVSTAQIVNQAYSKYPPIPSNKVQNDANYAAALHQARSIIQKRTRDQAMNNAVDAAVALAYGK